MNIILTLSQEQVDALTRSNETSNADPKTRPTLEVFTQTVCNVKIKEHVDAWQQRDAANMQAKLAANVLEMTKEDRDTVIAILDKYEIPPPKEVPPDVEPAPEEPVVNP